MKFLPVEEVIKELESGEITWDNVYEIAVKESIKALVEFVTLKGTNQQALKVNINSEFGALDNQYFQRTIETFLGQLHLWVGYSID